LTIARVFIGSVFLMATACTGMTDARRQSDRTTRTAADLEMRAVRTVVNWIVSGGETPGKRERALAKEVDPSRVERFAIVCPWIVPGARVSTDPRVEIVSIAAAEEVHRLFGPDLSSCWSLTRRAGSEDALTLRATTLFARREPLCFAFRFREEGRGLRADIRRVWR